MKCKAQVFELFLSQEDRDTVAEVLVATHHESTLHANHSACCEKVLLQFQPTPLVHPSQQPMSPTQQPQPPFPSQNTSPSSPPQNNQQHQDSSLQQSTAPLVEFHNEIVNNLVDVAPPVVVVVGTTTNAPTFQTDPSASSEMNYYGHENDQQQGGQSYQLFVRESEIADQQQPVCNGLVSTDTTNTVTHVMVPGSAEAGQIASRNQSNQQVQELYLPPPLVPVPVNMVVPAVATDNGQQPTLEAQPPPSAQ